MRDAFFDALYQLALQDHDIILVSADMGAPSLDKFRKDLPHQFIKVGIAEQNAVLLASGLALSGKKAFVYAIMPFVSTRIHEFIKIEMSLMKIPLTIVGVGSGYSYDESGPTHHTLEDIAILRPLPNLEILNPSDSVSASRFALYCVSSSSPKYLRLDRQNQIIKYQPEDCFEQGFSMLKNGSNSVIVATGNMVDRALAVAEQLAKKSGKSVAVIDLYRIKPLSEDFIRTISSFQNIISLEEHFLQGGIGSAISEIITDNDLRIRLLRCGVDCEYHYLYGGREHIHQELGLGEDQLMSKIASFISD